MIQSQLESNHTWKDKTKLTTNQIEELTKIVLHNSFFSYEGTLYHQILGCAMGSPVSVIIADLVMEHGEVQALPTFMASNRWWFRYVDDSNAKSTELHNSHHHLNAVNSHIQFTVEHRIPGYERLRCKYTENPPIPTSTRHLIDTTLHNIRDPSSAR